MQQAKTRMRVSNDRSRSNPILESERLFQLGGLRRENEQRQLDRLLELQQENVPIYRLPEFIRVDASDLKVSRDRIGVVGLVVDESGIGLVSQLRVTPSSCWEISVQLPFRQAQIQSLLLQLITEIGIDEGLPELLAFRISETLGEAMYGDSMDVACLLAIVDAANGGTHELLQAAAVAVLPLGCRELKPSKSIGIKLKAFVREFGRGSLLVRMQNDMEAARYDDYFNVVWQITDLNDFAVRLDREGLMTTFRQAISLKSEHTLAISTRIEYLISTESRHGSAKDFLRRVKKRFTGSTPLQLRLEVSHAEEDLHRHCGDFLEALKARAVRQELERNPLISCYERMASSDNRHAAALYDAHRFAEAIECLAPWHTKLQEDPRICLPETRTFLLNTFARCLVVIGDPRWETVFNESLQIQYVTNPESISRTENFLIHGFLRNNRLDDASILLNETVESTDPYRLWLRAEYARRRQDTWRADEDQKIDGIPSTSHVFGFAMQAAARQKGRDTPTRIRFLKQARDCFLLNVDIHGPNVKKIFGFVCDFAIGVLSKDDLALECKLVEFEDYCQSLGLSSIIAWYEAPIRELRRNRDWAAIENLFSRVPHL